MPRLSDLKLVLKLSKQAHRLDGASYKHIVCDLARMRFRKATLDREDYFHFRLYKRLRFEPEALDWYVGQSKMHMVSAALNDRTQVTAGWDKIVFDRIMRSAGLPVAPLKRYFVPMRHGSGTRTDLSTIEELVAFLRDPKNYPLFMKAACSQAGLHTLKFDQYRPANDMLLAANGEHLTVDEFVEQKIRKHVRFYEPGNGWLIQEAMKQHSALTDYSGTDTVSCIRLMVLLRNGKPSLAGSFLKIASPGEMTDHFRQGTSMNRSAAIDENSGKLSAIVESLWPEQAQASRHVPDFKIPFWNEALDVAFAGSRLFPGMRLQHWDIAITESGPVPLEVNDLGGTVFYQVLGQGLLEGEIGDALLERYDEVAAQRTKMGRKATQRWLEENDWIRRFKHKRPTLKSGQPSSSALYARN